MPLGLQDSTLTSAFFRKHTWGKNSRSHQTLSELSVPVKASQNLWASFPRVLQPSTIAWGSKEEKLTFSQFWRLEARNRGFGRTLLPPKHLGEGLSLPPPASGSPSHSLTCGSRPPVSSSALMESSPFCVCVFTSCYLSVGLCSDFCLLIRAPVILGQDTP